MKFYFFKKIKHKRPHRTVNIRIILGESIIVEQYYY
jgi:hypothetical protein